MDVNTWESFVRACEEPEDSDMPRKKRSYSWDGSTEQSSAIDSSSKSPAVASLVCGGGARSDAQPHKEPQVVGSGGSGNPRKEGEPCDGRISSGARYPRTEGAPCAEGTVNGQGQSSKRRYARRHCLDIFDTMIQTTEHADNPPSLWDVATEETLCTQKTVGRFAGYLTDPDKGHKTPTGGTLAIGSATDYLQDFLQSLNTRYCTSDRSETKLFQKCLKRVSDILHPWSARICTCIHLRVLHPWSARMCACIDLCVRKHVYISYECVCVRACVCVCVCTRDVVLTVTSGSNN